MTDSFEDVPTRSWRLASLYFAVVMLTYAVIILTARTPPPFVDYPDWVYQGSLFHGVLSGHPPAGYALKLYPVPNSVTTVGIGLLGTLLPWAWAGKVWICLYLALASFSTWALASSLKLREWRLISTLPAIVFLNLDFWYGHISFEIGMCLVMLLLSMLIREKPKWWIAGLLLLIFFTHMEACAGSLLLLGIWCAMKGEWRRLWASLSVIGVTLWYGIARFASGNQDGRGLMESQYRYGSGAFLVYKVNTFFKTFGYVNARTMDGLSQSERILGRGLFVLLIAASLCIACLCLIRVIGDAVTRSDDAGRRSMQIFVLALLVISLFLPHLLLGVADPGSRLLLMATSVGLFLVDWRRPMGTAIAGLSIIFCVVNTIQFAKLDHNPLLQGQPKDLPTALLTYGHVEPSMRVIYYEKLSEGRMDQKIFPSGIFREEDEKPR